MDEFDDDDIGELYDDVEVQVSSAINATQVFAQLPPEEDEVYGNGDENGDFQEVHEGVGALAGEEKEAVAEGEENGNENESESDSDSEDDLNIVLNDDQGNDNANGNVNSGKDGFQCGGSNGMVGNDKEFGIQDENEGNYGVENGGSKNEGSGGGGKRRYSGAGCISHYKCMRSESTVFSSNLRSNSSAEVGSYLSTFVRGDCENDGWTYQFGTNSIGTQSGRNFSLPRSRTILDVNIDALEQKPWRNTGADITDFFNFGFNEDSWKSYCNHLDRHRAQTTKVTGSSACQRMRHNKDHKAGSKHEMVQEASAKNIVHCSWKRAVSLSNETSSRQLQSEMLMGRAIQVEDGLSERQPSVDIRLPVERDSDVVIEIPIQGLEEDHSNSDKVACDEMTNYLHEAAGSRVAGDMLCCSASKDELPVPERSTERTRKSYPHRHTSPGDGDPLCSDSDNNGNLHISDATEPQNQELECDLDGPADEIKASDEPHRSVGRDKLTTTSKKTPQSSHSKQTQHSQSSSPSRGDYVGSRDGAYAVLDKFHDHLERASPNLASELRESITIDHHSSKDSRNHGVSSRSGYSKYAASSRNPVRRNMKFQQRRSSRTPRSKNDLDDELSLHTYDAMELHDPHYLAVGCHKQRKRHHGFDSYEDKDYLNREELYHFVNYRRPMFRCRFSNAFAGHPQEKDNQDSGYKGDPYPIQNVDGKQYFPEQRNPRLGKVEWQCNHYRRRFSVRKVDFYNYDVSRQLNTGQPPYLDNGNLIQSERKADGLHVKGRMKYDDFSTEHDYCNEFKQERYQPMPYNAREREYLENRHDRQLPHSRREVKSPLKSRRYESPVHDCEDIWQTVCEDERSRYARNQLPFHSYKVSQTAARGRGEAAPFLRNTVFEKHGRQKRQNCVKRYRGSIKLDGYACSHINDNERIQLTDDRDNFSGRRQYWQSEVLHCSEEEQISRLLEDNFKTGATSYPFGRTSRYGTFVSKPGSGHVGKLIDGTEPDVKRYNQPIEGGRCSQFDQSSSSVHRDNLGQALLSCWDSTDPHMVVGDGKSFRCSEAGSRRYCSSYDSSDWKDDLEQRTSNGVNELQSEKLSDSLREDSVDIEEGQIVAEGLSKKPMQEASESEDAKKLGVKNFYTERAIQENQKVEELENPRIKEFLAKMEKRRERFQQPITMKNISDNHCKPFADSNAATSEAKVQRPARKRKWAGC